MYSCLRYLHARRPFSIGGPCRRSEGRWTPTLAALRFHQPGFNGVVPLMRPAFIEDDSYFGKGVPRRRRRGPVTHPKKMATQFGSEMFMSEPLMANYGIQ